MDDKVKNDLNIIKESVLQVVPAEAIYLFGSYVYGTPSEDSDIDIYVVVPDDITEFGELYGDVLMILRSKKRRINLDMKLGHSSVFHRRKTVRPLKEQLRRKEPCCMEKNIFPSGFILKEIADLVEPYLKNENYRVSRFASGRIIRI